MKRLTVERCTESKNRTLLYGRGATGLGIEVTSKDPVTNVLAVILSDSSNKKQL